MSKVTSPEFRVSFPQVLEPKSFGGGKPKYSIVMMFPKSTDITAIKTMLMEVMKEKWPNEATRPKNIHNPIKDGDTDVMQDGTLRKDKYPECEGHWLVSAMSIQKPGLVDQNLQAIISADEFYAGCFARATLHAFAYAPNANNPGMKSGVGFGLNNVQKLRDGDSFSGRSKPENDFEVVETEATNATTTNAVQSDSFDNMFA